MEKQFIVKITGRVHGVLFRHSARTHAEKLGLTGWVRNEPDGSITLLAEGPEDRLEELLAWCRKGPPLARVDAVRVEWREKQGTYEQFTVT